ncbi:MAG: BON domain-containing protein [Vicinamibacteria bacterium]
MFTRLAVLTLAATVVAVTGASAQARSNLELFRAVSDQVTSYTQFTIFDSVSAEVHDGEVRLTGWVTMPYKREDIERRVARVDGARSVRNDIEVLPVSIFDNELRFRIARAIYGHSAFWNYAAMANPPIHIVVSGGRVTLAGVVRSEVDRMLARSLAAGFGAFEIRNELKTDAEVRKALEAI